MKIKFSKIAFKLFSYLSDKTEGKPFFVKYKLLIGTFLLSSVQASAQDSPKVIKEKQLDKRVLITCYKPAMPIKKITGRVVDHDNKPLGKVTITFSNGSENGYTDKDGNFEIETYINHNLIFSCEGYDNKKVTVRDLLKENVVVMIKSPIVNPMCYSTILDAN